MYELGTFDNNWEYATSIYKVKTKEKIVVRKEVKSHSFLWWDWTTTKITTETVYKVKYTYKKVSTNKDAMSVSVPKAPLFKTRVATLHTHPMGSMSGITKFSETDKKNAQKRGVPNYVYGPNGELRKYDPETKNDIIIFSNLPVSPTTPWIP